LASPPQNDAVNQAELATIFGEEAKKRKDYLIPRSTLRVE
jgi:hypothetical protein